MKKYYIETYGCQMNFAQSIQLENKMLENGFARSDSFHSADIIIINACSVREHAEKKVFNRIQFINSLKRKNNNFKLLVTGCFAQNNKEKIDSDIVIGTSRIKDIPVVLKNIKEERYIDVDMDKYEFLKPAIEDKYPFRCYVDITKGCDNYCSYCIVPYVKGRQVSRRSKDIISEIERLSDDGVKEVILLGQNVNSYGKDNKDISFSELLYKVNKIKGIRRIRFLTSHPKDFSNDITASIFENEKVAAHIHLPVQSGSNRILKLMGRKYDIEKYYSIIENISSYQKDFSLSTDFLVGFPGETEADFLQTIELAKKIGFNEAFMYKYSSRSYIAANNFPEEVPEEEKKRRLQYLIDFQKNVEKEKIKGNLDKIRTVLVEGESRRDKDKFVGRDELNCHVVMDDHLQPGRFYKVTIYDIHGTTLLGKKLNSRSNIKCA